MEKYDLLKSYHEEGTDEPSNTEMEDEKIKKILEDIDKGIC